MERMNQHDVIFLISVSLCASVILLFVPSEAQQKYRPNNPLFQAWSGWAPWDQYDNSIAVRTYYGWLRGFTIPWTIDDLPWNPEWEEQPKWFRRRINCFLGVPYAAPPLGNLRFKLPRRPKWGGTYEARHFRPSCPQRLTEIRKDIPTFPKANISEDCLYLNIFAPNITDHWQQDPFVRYPVVVFIHGGDWTYGSAQQIPGHVMATKEVVVVTFNYRLGALGFLTTEDRHGAGNWGMFDQQLALEFVKENIALFSGDPKQITLMGEGAGAASVGLHMVSPVTSDKGFFHQAAMMSGSDLSPMGYTDSFWKPRDYAHKLGELVNCPYTDSYELIECLRNNETVTWQAILDAQENVEPNNGDLIGMPWGPVQDGGHYAIWAFLPQSPRDLRAQNKHAKVKLIIGINAQDGVRRANETVRGLGSGIFEATFKHYVTQVLKDLRVIEYYQPRVMEAVIFQYTYWAEPQNRSARTQEFVNMLTDYMYGASMDEIAKMNVEKEMTYVYVFNYKSWTDYLPWWMGIGYSAALPYILGVPFMNETVLNETELIGRQLFDYDDRNMSDFMLTAWTNFAKYGEPTPNITRNVTWDPFNTYNLSFLLIDYWSYNWFRYRQNKYGFWNEYFPSIAKQNYLYPTATPTPAGQEYKYATGSMSATVIILLILLGVIIYLLVQSGREDRDDGFRESELPLSFMSTSRQSLSTMSGKSPLPEYRPPEPRFGGYAYGQSEI